MNTKTPSMRANTSNFGDTSVRSLIAYMYEATVLSGDHRRFLVARMGGTGSTWLAKALNSHPDVWCSHEGVLAQIHPRKDFDQYDIGCFVQRLASDLMHGAYAAAGDIGSVWVGSLHHLPPAISTGVLIRHPLRVIATNLRYAVENPNTFVPQPQTSEVEALFGVEADKLPPTDLSFLHFAETWIRVFNQVNPFREKQLLIRVEELSDVGRFQEISLALTGLEYSGDLVTSLVTRGVNVGARSVHSDEILSSWPQHWQAWYQSVVEPVAEKAGY